MLGFLASASRLVLAKGLGWMARHPVMTGTAAIGSLDAATNGMTTDYVVKPLGKGVVAVGKGIGGGVLDAGKSIVLDDENRGDKMTIPKAANDADGMIGMLKETVSPYTELMGQNGAYAIPAAFAALKLTNGGGSFLQNAFSAAVLGTVLTLGVKVAESYGLKLPGISGLFNDAATETKTPVVATENLDLSTGSPSPNQLLKPAVMQM